MLVFCAWRFFVFSFFGGFLSERQFASSLSSTEISGLDSRCPRRTSTEELPVRNEMLSSRDLAFAAECMLVYRAASLIGFSQSNSSCQLVIE